MDAAREGRTLEAELEAELEAAWEALGAPQWPTAAQNAKILAASEMRPEAVAAGADGDFDVGVLPPQGVVGVVIPRA